MQDLKDRLRERREKLDLSRVALAIKSGVSERTIAGYEAGTSWKQEMVEPLAKALGVSVGWLIGSEYEPEMMREGFGETEAELWKRRAREAEEREANLRNRLRELLDESRPTPKQGSFTSPAIPNSALSGTDTQHIAAAGGNAFLAALAQENKQAEESSGHTSPSKKPVEKKSKIESVSLKSDRADKPREA